MKRFVFTTMLIALSLGSSLCAQDLMTVISVDGDEYKMALSTTCKVTFNPMGIAVCPSSEDEPIGEFLYSDVKKILFQSNVSSVKTIEGTCINLYPNPVDNCFIVNGVGEGLQRLIIYTLNGKEICSMQYRTGDKVNVDMLKSGVYIVQIGNCACGFIKR